MNSHIAKESCGTADRYGHPQLSTTTHTVLPYKKLEGPDNRKVTVAEFNMLVEEANELLAALYDHGLIHCGEG